MRFCVVSDTKVGTGTPAAGAGLLLQNPQKATGLWLGVPTDFGDVPPCVGRYWIEVNQPAGCIRFTTR